MNLNNKNYIVVGNGQNDQGIYSKACVKREYKGFEYIDMKDAIYLSEKKPVGYEFTVEQNLVI